MQNNQNEVNNKINLSDDDIIIIYNKLNNIKPEFLKEDLPFSLLKNIEVYDTYNEIVLEYKKGKYKKVKKEKDLKKKGRCEDNRIVILE
jgi:hypothetical protein